MHVPWAPIVRPRKHSRKTPRGADRAELSKGQETSVYGERFKVDMLVRQTQIQVRTHLQAPGSFPHVFWKNKGDINLRLFINKMCLTCWKSVSVTRQRRPRLRSNTRASLTDEWMMTAAPEQVRPPWASTDAVFAQNPGYVAISIIRARPPRPPGKSAGCKVLLVKPSIDSRHCLSRVPLIQL